MNLCKFRVVIVTEDFNWCWVKLVPKMLVTKWVPEYRSTLLSMTNHPPSVRSVKVTLLEIQYRVYHPCHIQTYTTLSSHTVDSSGLWQGIKRCNNVSNTLTSIQWSSEALANDLDRSTMVVCCTVQAFQTYVTRRAPMSMDDCSFLPRIKNQ